jgi:hypothetical protein
LNDRRFVFAVFVAALLLAPGCYNLPYVDPGPRWIDKFDADGGVLAPPSWAAFADWTCGTRPAPNSRTGADGGVADGDIADAAAHADSAVPADATVADAGSDGGTRTACRPGPTSGLAQPFAFADSSNDVEYTVETHTRTGATVDFTSFRQFVFSANLSAPAATPLPVGTVFEVELDCSKNQTETSVSQKVPAVITNINAQGLILSRLDLSQFQFDFMSSNGSCLSQIDRIRFALEPGQNDQPQVTGTLALDDVSLQN